MKDDDAATGGKAPAMADGHPHRGAVDLLAFVAVLTFVVVLVLLRLQLAYAGIAGLAVGCMTVWARIRTPRRQRWLSGQFTYRGRNFSFVSAWGVEGQEAPAAGEPTASLEQPPPAPGAAP